MKKLISAEKTHKELQVNGYARPAACVPPAVSIGLQGLQWLALASLTALCPPTLTLPHPRTRARRTAWLIPT